MRRSGKTYQLGSLGSLEILWSSPAFVGSLLLWAALAGLGIWLFSMTPVQALLAGLAATLLHWFSELFHQYGHAAVARWTGFPMQAVHLGDLLLLGRSIYPPDEGDLPSKTHFQRALGGPLASLLLYVVIVQVAQVVRPFSEIAWLALFFNALENIFVFCIGALIPLGFNDGSTILRSIRNR